MACVRQGKRPRGRRERRGGTWPPRQAGCRRHRSYLLRAASWRINNSYLWGPEKPKKRNSVTLGAGKRTAQHKTAKHARQHRHGAVRHGAEQVDREALVEPAPALKVDDLARGADDAGALAAAHTAGAARRGQQEPALRLQARAHDFVRVRRHRGRHLCHRGAKEDRMRRNWPVVAMSFWKVAGGYVNDLSRHGQIKGGAYAR